MDMKDQDDEVTIPSSETKEVDYDRDHALATALQEQERAFAMLETIGSDESNEDEDEYEDDSFFTSQELANLELLEDKEEENEEELEEDNITKEEDEINLDEDLVVLDENVGEENKGQELEFLGGDEEEDEEEGDNVEGEEELEEDNNTEEREEDEIDPYEDLVALDENVGEENQGQELEFLGGNEEEDEEEGDNNEGEEELEEDNNTEEGGEDEIDPYEDLVALGEIENQGQELELLEGGDEEGGDNDEEGEEELEQDNNAEEGGEDEDLGEENQGLSQEEIIPILSHYICASIHLNTGIDKCVICQEEYEEGEALVALRCDHPFHDACITQWLQIKKTCPICCKEATKQKEK